MNPSDPPKGTVSDRLLPWRSVKELTGISRTTAWRLQNSGDFPRPVVISAGRVGWRESEVTAWKDALAPRGNQWSRRSPRRLGPVEEAAAEPQSPTLPVEEPVDRTPMQRQARNRPRSSQDQIAFDF